MGIRLFLYNLLILSAFVLGLPWIAWQILFVEKRRRGVFQRFGAAPRSERPVIWCHAVSVGEVKAVAPMLSILQKDRRAGGRIVLSTVTVTGQETARRECGFVERIFYFPLDLPFSVRRALDRVRPELFITAETEIWPNFFAACFRRKIPVIVVNGRISDGSFPRYLKFRWFFLPFIEGVTLFLMQSEEDARRILELGARPEAVKVTGNTKYDRVPESVVLPETVRQWAEKGFFLVAGSTHRGEEEAILDAVEAVGDRRILTALVPRHPERFDEVAGLLETKGVPFTRYSRILDGGAVEGKVLLVDAMGVLDGFYALADLAFVGGSLVPIGGHNLLEPAMHGVPVLTGPHYHNFREVVDSLISNGGCILCRDVKSLSGHIEEFVKDMEKTRSMGASSKQAYEATKGASESNAGEILGRLEILENMGAGG